MPVPAADLPVDAAGGRLLRSAWQSARPASDLETCRLPEMRRRRARETDTMDTFVDSSWYFVRFTDPHNASAPTIPRSPIIGCRSTNILAASNMRFCICSIHASSRAPCDNCGYLDLDEPFAGLFTQGMVVHETYRDAQGQWLAPSEVRIDTDGEARRAVAVDGGGPVEIGPIEKMSKSRRNTVDPDEIIATYGADTARWFMLSDSPPERDVIWTEAGVQGAFKQTQRLWRLVCEIERVVGPERPPRPSEYGEEARRIRQLAHAAMARIEDEIERLRFNVCIAAVYELANELSVAVGAIERRRSPTISEPLSPRPATFSFIASRR